MCRHRLYWLNASMIEQKKKKVSQQLSIIFSFCCPFYFICQASKGGGGGTKRPYRDGDLKRIRSGGEKIL